MPLSPEVLMTLAMSRTPLLAPHLGPSGAEPSYDWRSNARGPAPWPRPTHLASGSLLTVAVVNSLELNQSWP